MMAMLIHIAVISYELQDDIRQKNHSLFRRINLELLLPYLNEKRMITPNDMEYFNQTIHTSQEKLDHLFQIIPKNGSNFLYEFIFILRKSSWKFHDEFATILKREINKVQGKFNITQFLF